MKRLISTVLMTAVVGLAAYTLSGAQDQAAGERSAGEARRGGPRFGHGGGFGALRGLELTEEQRRQIRAIREEHRAAGRQEQGTGIPAGAALHRALQAELFAEAPDAGRIAELQEQLARAEAARRAAEIEMSAKIAQVLTAEQRAQVRERLQRPRPDGFDGPGWREDK